MIGATRESVNKDLRALRDKEADLPFGKHHRDRRSGGAEAADTIISFPICCEKNHTRRVNCVTVSA
ncbi:MAG: hypothetical protein KJ649_05395 [Proteobacteria bacterium]|nr:hypothetical protein [Pseudomonadota bacterium]MBU1744310.1 hypothetical protein [Pseudomonadota bacterium]